MEINNNEGKSKSVNINDDDVRKSRSKKNKDTKSDVTSDKRRSHDRSSKKHKKKQDDNNSDNEAVLSNSQKRKSKKDKPKKNDESSFSDVLSRKKERSKSKKNDEDSNNDIKIRKKHNKNSKKVIDETISENIKNEESSTKHKKKKRKKSKKHHKSDSEVLTDGKTWEPKDERIKELINEVLESIGGIERIKEEELKKELDRQNIEREKRIDAFINRIHISSNEDTINTTDLENEMNVIQNEKNSLEQAQKQKGINDIENNKNQSASNLSGKRKYLHFRLMEKENKIDALAYKCKIFSNKYEGLKQALKLIERFVIDKEKMKRYRNTLYKLRDEIKGATKVIDKVQNMAHELLPVNVSSHCKKIDDTKKRLIEMQDDLLEKRHFTKKKIVINEKEIEALTIATTGETDISKLIEQQRIDEIRRLIFHQIRIEELNKIIEHCNENLILVNLTLEEAQALNLNAKESATKNINIKEDRMKENIKKEKIKELKENNKMVMKQIEMFKTNLKAIEEEYKKSGEKSKLENELIQLLTELEKETNQRRKLAEKLQVETVLRKTYYNQVEDMKGAIRVYCRIRPINSTEAKRGDDVCFDFPDIYTIVAKPKYKKGTEKAKEYLFDQVFTLTSTQEDIFTNIDRLVEIVFTGFNVCVFAYGQTGSGKTYTLIGNMDNGPHMGIVPRSFKKVYELIGKNKNFIDTECNFYMLELYNDKLLDLLKADAEYTEKLEIKKNEHGMVIVPGLTTCYAHSVDDMTKYFHDANKNRHIASTKMNSESSRSHLILTIIFKFTEKSVKKKYFGKLSIIDLAGSERSAKSGVTGINLTEATAINKALTALGDVISALTQTNKGFVPYRNHKLTQLMQDSLGGTAKTVMIVNLSPVDYNLQESISSLNYATRVKTITNEGVKVADMDEVHELKLTLEKLINGETVNIP